MAEETLNLKTLKRIVQDVSMAVSLSEAMRVTVNLVWEALSADACAAYLIDPRQSRFVLVAAKGFASSAVCVFSMGLQEGLVGLVGQRGEPINLEDAPSHPRYQSMPGVGEEQYRAFLGVPVIHQRKLLGVLVLQKKDPISFEPAEEAFMVTVSAQLGGIIAHAEAKGELLPIFEHQVVAAEAESVLRFVQGTAASSGVGIGQIVVLHPKMDLENVADRLTQDPNGDIDQFMLALAKTKNHIGQLSETIAAHIAPQEHALFEAYLQLLSDDSFVQAVIVEIRDGHWAPGALKRVIGRHVQHFQALEDPYLRERATDLQDLGRRILEELAEQSGQSTRYFPQTILVGEELTAASLAEIPREKLVGIVSVKSSPYSHVAIIARAMGIPAVTGATGMVLRVLDGKSCIVDGYFGRVYIEPNVMVRREFVRLQEEERELAQGLEELRGVPAETVDGLHVPLLVNTGLVSDFHVAREVGAEGVGLYRSEVPFLIRDRFPSEEEQRLLYRDVLQAFKHTHVVLRTLDIGGDKMLPYFPVHEQNPALGWRGIRITLDHPEIFLVQLRAMLWASDGLNNLHILLPMISSVQEVDESLKLIHQAYQEVREEGAKITMPQVGAMVEIPAAVYQAEALATRLDFLSVGSNDLTQYILAVDRNNTRVANLYDSFHPAVLSALSFVVQGVHRQGKPVGICGELAGDPVATVLLLAMGFDYFSMNATSIPRVKWVIRNFSRARAEALWHICSALQDGQSVRRQLMQELEAVGLGGLIRAGK